MACIHYLEMPGWRRLFVRWPKENPVPWFHRTPEQTAAAEKWLETDEAQGVYICQTTFPPDLKPGDLCPMEDVGHTWLFSDANTAFAFKMRFG